MTSSLMLDDVTDSCSLGSRSGDVVKPESVLEEEREHLVQVQPSLPPLLLLVRVKNRRDVGRDGWW